MKPHEMVAAAQALRARPEPKMAADYVEAIRVLRIEKRRTWTEIAEWFGEHGVPFSKPTIRRAARLANIP